MEAVPAEAAVPEAVVAVLEAVVAVPEAVVAVPEAVVAVPVAEAKAQAEKPILPEARHCPPM